MMQKKGDNELNRHGMPPKPYLVERDDQTDSLLESAFDYMVENKVAIAELEAVGLSLKMINSLEDNLGAIWMDDLPPLPSAEIEEIRNIGPKSVKEFYHCIKNYYKEKVEEESKDLNEWDKEIIRLHSLRTN
jgi:hypothetical protein